MGIFTSIKTHWQGLSKRNKIIVIAIAVLISVVIAVVVAKHLKKDNTEQATSDNQSSPAIIPNNNPGNIRNSSTTYQGEVDSTNAKLPAFKAFETPAYGYRAMASLLYSYVKAGYNTLDTIINRYAPPTDNNDTGSYISTVSSDTGFYPTQVFTVDDFTNGNFQSIMQSMAKVEQGKKPNMADLQAGYQLFLNSIS